MPESVNRLQLNSASLKICLKLDLTRSRISECENAMEPAPLSSSDDLANPLLENTDEGTELARGTELVDADGAELREATDGAHPLVADGEAQGARPPSPTTSSPSRASMASVAAAPDALREGLVVELWHARRRYAAAGSHEHLARYLSRFVAGTWCRCVVEDFDGETYTLRYEDGPHAARSRAFAPVAGLPRGTRFVRCPRDCIEVDYEASYCAVSPEGRYALSHGVVVVPFIVAAQLFCYFYYAARECERTGRAIEAYAPVAGPGGDRFAFAATSHFPGCRDLRGREWYRFWTYQWLHEGWAHVSTTARHSNLQPDVNVRVIERFGPAFFGRASRARREQSIRPKISRIDVDVVEREHFKVWSGRPEPAVDVRAGRRTASWRSSSASPWK